MIVRLIVTGLVLVVVPLLVSVFGAVLTQMELIIIANAAVVAGWTVLVTSPVAVKWRVRPMFTILVCGAITGLISMVVTAFIILCGVGAYTSAPTVQGPKSPPSTKENTVPIVPPDAAAKKEIQQRQQSITQNSTGANSPNIVVGDGSTVTIQTETVRDIPSAALPDIVNRLAAFRGMEVKIRFSNTPEPMRFADQLAELLIAAGWTVGGNAALFTDQIPGGLGMHSEGPARAAAEALEAELKSLKIPVTNVLSGDDTTAGKILSISVGALPIR